MAHKRKKMLTIDKTYGENYYSYDPRKDIITVTSIDTNELVWKGDPFKFSKLVPNHHFLKVIKDYTFIPRKKGEK